MFKNHNSNFYPFRKWGKVYMHCFGLKAIEMIHEKAIKLLWSLSFASYLIFLKN